MRLTEFVDKVQSRLDNLNKVDRVDLDILVRVESLLAYDSLLARLVSCVPSHQVSADANSETLKSLVSLLEERWVKIRLTDANYCHSPDSLASKAYYILAEEIAAVIGGQANKKTYDYLFPTVDANACVTTKGTLHDLKLHEFIFRDGASSRQSGFLNASSSSQYISLSELNSRDVGEPIEIIKTLKSAADTPGRMLMSTCKPAKAYLNDSEVERVRAHSAAGLTEKYYVYLKAPGYDTSAIHTELVNALASEKYRVGSTYGIDGTNKLLLIVMSSYNTREKLANILASKIPQNEWSKFLAQAFRMPPKGLVFSQDNNDEAFRKVLEDHSTYFQDSNYNAAVLYCLAYSYKFNRERKPKFTASYVPAYAQSCFTYSREEKLAAVDVLLQYLTSNREVTVDKFQEQMDCSENVTRERRKGALYYGLLGDITKAVTKRLRCDVNESARRCHLYNVY